MQMTLFRDDNFEEDNIVEEESAVELNKGDFDGLLVAPSDWTLESLHRQIGKQIDLDPAFQRRDVWTPKAQSALIESFFLNIPIPQILLAAKRNERSSFIVIDGKQRLLAIKNFIDGKHLDGKVFRLRGMRVLKSLEGRSWEDIKTDNQQADLFLNSTQRATVLRGWQDEKTLYEIFYRLNSGSVKLSPMELRMSLHPGDFVKYIIDWTEKPRNIHRLLKLKRADKRMNDVELAIRYLAFNSPNGVYKGDLKSYLDDICKAYNNDFHKNGEPTERLLSLIENLEAAIEAGFEIFNENLCRKWDANEYTPRFNRAIFDIIIGSLSDPSMRKWALDNKEIYEATFKETCGSDKEFISTFESSTKDSNRVFKKYNTWYSALHELSGIKLDIPEISS